MSTETTIHKPVMPDEMMSGLSVRREGNYVDATLGRGGHSSLLLEMLADEGRLIMFDRDPQAIAAANQRFGADPRCCVRQSRLSELKTSLAALGIEQVAGIMMDLGVSSPQLDQPERGFSFMHDGPLDMRMDPGSGQSAAEWLQQATVDEIRKALFDYGEERRAGAIARAIVTRRAQRPLQTTAELAELVSDCLGPAARKHKKHPATRTFQAIRIVINDELQELRSGLTQALQVLEPGGRLAVLAFHSLEDRIVKRSFNALARPAVGNRRLPQPAAHNPDYRLIGKWLPTAAEIASNPRSRSAVLRVIEYCADRPTTAGAQP
ncbi:MAG: 16S rRNA (cytosine(1402)-N(4))-methyltransferase RsmH [Wenzhouxiangellaceae bacterium]